MSGVIVPGSNRVASVTWEVRLDDEDPTKGLCNEAHVFEDEDEAFDFMAEHPDSDITKRVHYIHGGCDQQNVVGKWLLSTPFTRKEQP